MKNQRKCGDAGKCCKTETEKGFKPRSKHTRHLFFKQMNLSLHKMIKQTLHISNGFSLPLLLESLTTFFYIHLQLWLKMHELTEDDLIPQSPFPQTQLPPVPGKPKVAIMGYDTRRPKHCFRNRSGGPALLACSSRYPTKPKCHPHYTSHEGWDGGIDQSLCGRTAN